LHHKKIFREFFKKHLINKVSILIFEYFVDNFHRQETQTVPPSRDTDWQTGLKRKIQQSAAYRRPTSLTEISTG
jgi:hypothetical protein